MAPKAKQNALKKRPSGAALLKEKEAGEKDAQRKISEFAANSEVDEPKREPHRSEALFRLVV